MSASERDLDAARAVVARWLDGASDPRAEFARLPALRHASAAERARIVELVRLAIGGLRRAEFALAGDEPRPSLAAWLVVHAAVHAGLVPVERAAPLLGLSASLLGRRLAAEQAALAGAGDPVLRLALQHSLPDWFSSRALQQFGDDAARVAAALSATPPRTLRANLLRTDGERLTAALAAVGLAARRGAFAATAVHVDGDADLFALRCYHDGLFEQQDEASQLAALLTAPPPRGRVLDLCAGSGGKTLALAALLQNRGTVLATDVHERRLAALRPRLARAGADNVLVRALDGAAAEQAVAEFARRADRILVDAPCSGSGSWRRRPEARWRIDEAALAELRAQQATLLRRAADWLQPGARLVYATCSLLTDENEAQIEALLRERSDLELVRPGEILGNTLATRVVDSSGRFLSLRPDLHGTDGFFTAVLRRPRAPSR